MSIYRTFDAPKGYVRIYSARPFADAEKLAVALQEEGRTVVLVYSHYVSYAVYARS